MALRIIEEPDPSLADEQVVKDALGQWNVGVTGYSDYAPAYFFLRDGSNAVKGAVLAYTWGRMLHVDTFWVSDKLRGQGWGTKLLEAAHEAGRAKGAELAFLDTFCWQARPFYERFGYKVIAEVPLPPGFSRFYMLKSPL